VTDTMHRLALEGGGGHMDFYWAEAPRNNL